MYVCETLLWWDEDCFNKVKSPIRAEKESPHTAARIVLECHNPLERSLIPEINIQYRIHHRQSVDFGQLSFFQPAILCQASQKKSCSPMLATDDLNPTHLKSLEWWWILQFFFFIIVFTSWNNYSELFEFDRSSYLHKFHIQILKSKDVPIPCRPCFHPWRWDLRSCGWHLFSFVDHTVSLFHNMIFELVTTFHF